MDKIRKVLHHLNRKSTRIIPKFSPVLKFLFASLLVITLTFFVNKVYAQVSVLENTKNAVKAGSGQEFWLHNAVSSQIVSGTMILSGDDVGTTNAAGAFLPQGGAIAFTANAISSLYKPQASGIQYIAQLKDNLLGKPAYAQGTGVGFKGLEALLPIWRSFRNVVYLLSAFFFVVIGIMIMLRVKISPQAVISVQSAIPQIIITLILVTFSYAIAGLLIDISNLFLSLIIAVLYSSQGVTNFTQPLVSWKMILNPVVTTFPTLSNPNFGTIFSMTNSLAPYAVLALLGAVIGALIGGIIGAGNPVFLLAGGGIGAALILLIMQILVLSWLIKLFFGMVRCYVTLLFKIILAPLEIGLGAYPGSKVNFTTWLWDFIANLAVFPVTVIFLLIVNMIIDKIKWGAAIWTPGVIDLGVGVLNVASIISGGFVPVAIGLAALMILSKLPEMIPQYVFMLKPSPWGTAVGEGVGGILPSMGNKISRANAAIGTAAESARNIDSLTSSRKIANSNVDEKSANAEVTAAKSKTSQSNVEVPKKQKPEDNVSNPL